MPLQRWIQIQLKLNVANVDKIEWHLGRFTTSPEPDFHGTIVDSCCKSFFGASIEWSFQFRHAIQHSRKNEIKILSIGQASLHRWKIIRISRDSVVPSVDIRFILHHAKVIEFLTGLQTHTTNNALVTDKNVAIRYIILLRLFSISWQAVQSHMTFTKAFDMMKPLLCSSDDDG